MTEEEFIKIMNSKTEHRHNEATLSVRPATGSWSLTERKVTTADVIGFEPLALLHLRCVDFGLGPSPRVLFFLSLQEGL